MKETEMSKEKQIEEMAKLIAVQRMYGCNEKDTCDMSCQVYKCGCIPYEDATILYNAGYRKQSEGEWVDNYNGTFTCTVCGGHASKMNYCGRCGAKMKGGAE